MADTSSYGCNHVLHKKSPARSVFLTGVTYLALCSCAWSCNQIGGCTVPMIGNGIPLFGTTANSTATTIGANNLTKLLSPPASTKAATTQVKSAVQPLDLSLPQVDFGLFGVTANTTATYIDWKTGQAVRPTQKNVFTPTWTDVTQVDGIHNHMYRYQGQRQISNSTKSAGNLVFTTTWDNNSSGQPDIDNHVLLPGGQGAYIRTTSTIPQRSDQPFYSVPANQQHVFSTQYGIVYNGGASIAVLSGEVGGGGWIRNLGCAGVSNPNCERITITGTTSGTYQQQAHNFNAYNLPD